MPLVRRPCKPFGMGGIDAVQFWREELKFGKLITKNIWVVLMVYLLL